MTDRLDRRWRVGPLFLAVAVALILPACGGDSDAGVKTAERPTSGIGDSLSATRQGSARERIEATVRYMRQRFKAAAGDRAAAADYCAKLTAEHREDLTSTSFTGAATCPAATAEFSRSWSKRGYAELPIKIYSISVKGREAVVKTSGGVVGHATYLMRLVNDGGEWKLPSGALEPL